VIESREKRQASHVYRRKYVEFLFCKLAGKRVFENRVLRRIFGLTRDEVTGEWRKLHNKELYNLYSSPDIIRQVKSSQGE
jgi:hypothetical protein